MAESTQFPPGMPNWLKKLMDTQRRGSEFWSGLEAGLPDYARTQAANFLNSASGSLGRLNEQVTGAHGQAADALSNAGTNAIGFGFQGADFLRGMMGSNPPTQNIPAVQTLSRAAEVIPQQLNATYGAVPQISGQFPAPYGRTGPFIPSPIKTPGGRNSNPYTPGSGPFIPISDQTSLTSPTSPTTTPGGRAPMPTAQNPTSPSRFAQRFLPIGARPSVKTFKAKGTKAKAQ